MQKIVGILILGIGAWCFAFSAVAQTAENAPEETEVGDIGVMSFNLRYGAADDGENSWPHRRDMVVEAVRAYMPDLLGTQETLDFQAEHLAEGLPEYAWIGRGREADGGGEMTAVFYHKERFELMDSGHFWLSETPDEPGSMSWDTSLTRMTTWLSLHHHASGKEILWLNTHFDHRGEQARLESAKVMVEMAANLLEAHEVVFVTGDFNTRGGETEPWHVFDDAGYLDAWNEAAYTEGPTTTWGGFQDPDPNSDSRIDWVLYKGAAKALYCQTVTFNREGRYPSDHYPVYARFQFDEISGDNDASEE